MPREEPSADFKLLTREIRDIKSKLAGLDNKLSKKLDAPRTKPSTEIKTIPKQHSYNPHIYPGWWGSTTTNQDNQSKKKKWEDTEWRKKHELDCAATARECLKQNRIASTKRPIKMLFDKKEFSRPYLHRNPNPKIIAKQAPEQQESLEERNKRWSNEVGPESSAKDTENYEEEVSESSPQMQKMVEDCVDSPIIKYFSDKYHETVVAKEGNVEEGGQELRESESIESRGYYTSDLPREYTEEQLYHRGIIE